HSCLYASRVSRVKMNVLTTKAMMCVRIITITVSSGATDGPGMPNKAKTGVANESSSALALLDQLREWGVPHACVTADADYGDKENFLDGLEQRDERYVVAIRADFRVRIAGTGKSALQRVDTLLAERASRRWRTIRWRQGSRGWLAAEFHAVRAWRQTSQGDWRIGWLIGERPRAGRSGDRRYYWSNLAPTTPLEVLVEYAHRRH